MEPLLHDDDCQPVDVDELAANEEVESQALYQLPPHQKCAAHRMNNIASRDVEKANLDKPFKKLSRATHAKAQALFNKQQGRPQAADIIRKHCGGKLLVIPNATRWNSTFDAYQRLREIISVSADQCDGLMDALGLPRFNNRDCQFIAEYCQVFGPFAKVLNILQGEKNCYIGVLLPILTRLKNTLQEEATKVEFCGPLAAALVAGIEQRFSKEFEDDKYYVAAALHPRFKVTWIASTEKRAYVWNLIQTTIEANSSQIIQEHEAVADQQEDLDEFFPLRSEAQSTECSLLDMYKAQPLGNLSDLKKFPVLERLFRKYNTLLPSSAAVERVFSHGGDIFGKKRFSLSDDHFERKLLLKVNQSVQ